MSDMVLLSVCGFFGTDNFSPLLNHVDALAVDQYTPLAACLLRPDILSLMLPEGRNSMERVNHALIRAGRQIVDDGRYRKIRSGRFPGRFLNWSIILNWRRDGGNNP